MVWLFAAVIVVLAVYHSGFRRFLLACSGCLLVIVVVVLIRKSSPDKAVEQPIVRTAAMEIDPCASAVDKRSCFFAQGSVDPDANAVLTEMKCKEMLQKKIPFDPDLYLHCKS